jgi:hypothetical protein
MDSRRWPRPGHAARPSDPHGPSHAKPPWPTILSTFLRIHLLSYRDAAKSIQRRLLELIHLLSYRDAAKSIQRRLLELNVYHLYRQRVCGVKRAVAHSSVIKLFIHPIRELALRACLAGAPVVTHPTRRTCPVDSSPLPTSYCCISERPRAIHLVIRWLNFLPRCFSPLNVLHKPEFRHRQVLNSGSITPAVRLPTRTR